MAEEPIIPEDPKMVFRTLAEIEADNIAKANATPPATPPITPAEPPATPPAEPPATPPTEPINPVSWFNTKFNTKFEKDEDVETHFKTLSEKATKAEQLEAEVQAEKERLANISVESVNEFKKSVGITDDYLRFFMLRSQFPEAQTDVLERVLTKDFTDTLKTDPIEILIDKELLDHPEIGTREKAERRIYKHYGINPENKDEESGAVIIDDDAETDILIDAKTAVKEFNGIKEKIKLPETVNLVAQKELENTKLTERYNKNKPLIEPDFKKTIPALLDNIVIEAEKNVNGKKEKETVFTFSMQEWNKSAHVKRELEESLEVLAKTIEAYTPELKQQIIDASVRTLKGQFVLSHLPDMFQTAKDHWEAEFRKKYNVEVHNPTEIKTDGAPKVQTDAEKQRATDEKSFSEKTGLKERQVMAR